MLYLFETNYTLGDYLEITFARDADNTCKAFFQGQAFEQICIRADVERGVRALAENTDFWRLC